jgi:hypothetical protein
MGMAMESSRLPSLDELRRAAERQGVRPSDEDLRAVLGFLEAVLPAVEEIEASIPPDLAPGPAQEDEA